MSWFERESMEEPTNEEQDSVAFHFGSAYTLHDGNRSRFLLTSALYIAQLYKQQGWKVVGEIHKTDFQGTIGYEGMADQSF